MSTDKFYKNPDRNKPETFRPSEPIYKSEGIEPEIMSKNNLPTNAIIIQTKPSAENARLRKPSIRQPYGTVTESPIGVGPGKVSIPNVGNNMEHSWTSVNGVIDDLSEDILNHPVIDNNEFVSEEAFNLPKDDQVEAVNENWFPPMLEVQQELNQIDNKNYTIDHTIYNIIQDLSEGDYLLLINGEAICSGSIESVQEQAKLLVFGEHEVCDGNPIPVEDLTVIKKVTVKVGLFLD